MRPAFYVSLNIYFVNRNVSGFPLWPGGTVGCAGVPAGRGALQAGLGLGAGGGSAAAAVAGLGAPPGVPRCPQGPGAAAASGSGPRNGAGAAAMVPPGTGAGPARGAPPFRRLGRRRPLPVGPGLCASAARQPGRGWGASWLFEAVSSLTSFFCSGGWGADPAPRELPAPGGAGGRAAQWRLSPPARRGGPFTRAAGLGLGPARGRSAGGARSRPTAAPTAAPGAARALPRPRSALRRPARPWPGSCPGSCPGPGPVPVPVLCRFLSLFPSRSRRCGRSPELRSRCWGSSSRSGAPGREGLWPARSPAGNAVRFPRCGFPGAVFPLRSQPRTSPAPGPASARAGHTERDGSAPGAVTTRG